MKEIFRSIYRETLKLLPTKISLNIDYFRGYHRLINFKNPKYFGEKIQYLKLYGNLEQFTKYADKYAVRDYISSMIGEEYLIPLIAVYDSTDEINYEKLPSSFVLKLNTGSGYNIIVNNKNELDKNKTSKKINYWLNENFYKIRKEYQYKNIDNKILCEQFINDKNGELLDYKFFCFDGKVQLIKVDVDRFDGHKANFYDVNWNILDIKEGNFQNSEKIIEMPLNFNEMVEIAEKLASTFQFVRVDLYNVDGKIYFGELTFTPASGANAFKPIEYDLKYGSLIRIGDN